MSEQQIQKVRVKRLAHVGFWATDVAAQTRFYRQVLGFNLRATEINSAGQDVEFEDANTYLSLGDEHHCLGLFNDTRPATSNGRGPVKHTRLHHIAFEVDTDAELAALAANPPTRRQPPGNGVSVVSRQVVEFGHRHPRRLRDRGQ